MGKEIMEHKYLFVITYDGRIDKIECESQKAMDDVEIMESVEYITPDDDTLDISELKKIEVQYDNGVVTESFELEYVPRRIREAKSLLEGKTNKNQNGLKKALKMAELVLGMYEKTEDKKKKMLITVVPLDFLNFMYEYLKEEN